MGTAQLLNFARRQKVDHELQDLNVVVDHVVVMLGRLLGYSIDLVKRLDPAGAPVRADRSQLEQVLMNLLLNARDAMPDGGTITISTTRGPDIVRLRVEDTGSGMDDATRCRAFEPFFTTKDAGKGSGHGLSTVNTIVKQSGGRVEVSSQVGVGTTFDVILPVAGSGHAA